MGRDRILNDVSGLRGKAKKCTCILIFIITKVAASLLLSLRTDVLSLAIRTLPAALIFWQLAFDLNRTTAALLEFWSCTMVVRGT